MLNSFEDLRGYALRAADGRTGEVDDIYFNDRDWQVRYLVAAMGFPLFGRQSLVGAEKLERPETDRRAMPVTLTEEEILAAPTPEAAPPVSKQPEAEAQRQALRWPSFALGAAGAGYTPLLAEQHIRKLMGEAGAAKEADRQTGDPNLRSMNALHGYTIAARDGTVGTVSDFLIDPDDWTIRYLVDDTGTLLPGKQVVLATAWVDSIDWQERLVTVDVEKAAVESSPEIGDLASLDRSREEELIAHYAMAPH